tara:strand:+ start:1779 stop:2120 length:342 start_codon:yes stop_codon:yes gene_type:complete
MDEFGSVQFFVMLGEVIADMSPAEEVPHSVHWDQNFGWLNVTLDVRERWSKAYPTVDIDRELASAHQWLLSNPKRRKKDYVRFTESWFRRAAKSKLAHGGGYKDPPKRTGFDS